MVVLIVYGVRRSTRMSDELSKEWEEKLRTIKPSTTTTAKEPQLKEKEKLQPSPPRDEKVRDLASYSAFQAELRNYKTELQRYEQEMAKLRDNEASKRKEIESLRNEIHTLQERLGNSRDEIQELRTSIEKSMKEQIATLTQDVQAETSMRKEIESLKTEIGTLQERLQTSRDEIQKLRTSIDESAKPQIVSQPQDIRPQHAQETKRAEQPKRGGWTLSLFGSNPPSRTCPTCKRTLRPQDQFCDYCGQQTPPSR